MTAVSSRFLREARLGGTQKPFKFCTDLLVPAGEGPLPSAVWEAAFEPAVSRLACSLSAWAADRRASLEVGGPQGTLEQFEDVALHHLLHFAVSQGHREIHWGVAGVGLCGEVSAPGQ